MLVGLNSKNCLKELSSKNLTTEAESDTANELLMHAKTKEKSIDLVLTSLSKATEVTT